ncbi:MAG: PEP-CTERM sorting domain-containing protein [Rhodoferax sp.]|nr:PEP-CTERM sorting domain-containing protein [Rhodoferax sp.]
MNPAQFMNQTRRLPCLALVVAGLLVTWSPPSSALYTPSVAATIASAIGGGSGSPVNLIQTQPGAPIILSLDESWRDAGVWTGYGLNRAASRIALSNIEGSKTPAYDAWVRAISTWTDQITISTPDALANAPLRLRFSIRLDGHLEAHENDFTNAAATVLYEMISSDMTYGEGWVVRPSFRADVHPTGSSTDGGHESLDVDTILHGELIALNGHTFNLISSLHVDTQALLMGPPAGAWAESLFGNSAEWLGATVWNGDTALTDFTIRSGSGFDYAMRTTSVPEPSVLYLLGIGLFGLGVLRRRA